MKTRMIWRLSVAALLLVLCWPFPGQADESKDLPSVPMDSPQAQAVPAYSAQADGSSDLSSDGMSTLQTLAEPTVQATSAACSTAGYKVDDAVGYAFEDISGTGSNITMTDDGEVAIGIGFPFNFYCTTYTTVTVGGNGALSFDAAPQIRAGNSALPHTSVDVTTLIAGFWDDLNSGAGGAVYAQIKGVAPNRRLIVQWNAVPHFGNVDNTTFEIILFETTNKILFKYQDVNFANALYDFGASATVGIQKDGTTAVLYSYNTPSLADGDAILFTPQAEPCPTAGYYYDDMVPYSFEDISGTGTNLGLTLDTYASVPLPFSFSFYCVQYSTIYVNDSGVINFADQNQTYVNSCLPATISTLPTFIAPYWDDLFPSALGAAIYYQVKGASPNRRMIIQWNNVTRFGGSGGDITFQVILYETTNKILFQYQDVTISELGHLGASATVGVQGDSTRATQYSCNTASLSDGLAILFSPYREITSPSTATVGLDYDCHRNGVWVATEDGNIYMLNAGTHVVEKTINLVGKVPASYGWSTGVSVLDNGNLLLADYNGPSGFDDYLFEFNPDTETLVNYWPLDGALNTSTDGTNIHHVVDVDMVFEPFRRAYVTSGDTKNLYEVQLTPGKPGAWKTLAVHPLGSLSGNTLGIDRVACYEDTPITGFAVSDWSSTTVNYYDANLALLSNFGAGHGNIFNSGVTVVPGNPAKLWVTDFDTDKIAIFDTQQKCTMHCGKFPWHEIIGAISQGSSTP